MGSQQGGEHACGCRVVGIQEAIRCLCWYGVQLEYLAFPFHILHTDLADELHGGKAVPLQGVEDVLEGEVQVIVTVSKQQGFWLLMR